MKYYKVVFFAANKNDENSILTYHYYFKNNKELPEEKRVESLKEYLLRNKPYLQITDLISWEEISEETFNNQTKEINDFLLL
jgi:hypothetical protein